MTNLLRIAYPSAKAEVLSSEQKFEKRWVKTGLSDGINIEITEGLAKADKVKGDKIDPKKGKQEEAKKS